MAINDNLWITQGNTKAFAFELKDDYDQIITDLKDAVAIDFVLQDMERNQALLITKDQIELDQKINESKKPGWVTVTVKPFDSESLSVGMYRYAIKARWDGERVHEWTFPNVLHVLAGIVS